jgi:hypothetical protein
VHQRVGRILGQGVTGADRLEQRPHRLARQGGDGAVVGRDVEDPDPSAARRRQERDSGLGGSPEAASIGAGVERVLHTSWKVVPLSPPEGDRPRRRPVLLDDRAPPGVMAGDDPANRSCHRISPVFGELSWVR